MKKLMISLCALCIVGAAGAQVAPLSEKAQRLMQTSMSQKAEMQEVQTLSNRKDQVKVDSFAVQSAYDWDKWVTFSWFSYPGQDLTKNGYCNEDKIAWVYGTGGMISFAGSGEIGYHFSAGSRSYYDLAHLYPNMKVPYAAFAKVVRAPSTSLLHDGVYDSMPFYFKLYDYTKVNNQRVVESLTEYGPLDNYVRVIYPTDPERYSLLSDTVMVPAGCFLTEDGNMSPFQFNAKAEFKDIKSWERLGEDFCLSMMFPIDWDEEGDSVMDAAWNAQPMIMSQENGEYAISEVAHSVYIVYDFARTTSLWKDNRPQDHKRFNGLVADSITQPNARYAIMPFDSWYMQDGKNTTGEPYMIIYTTDWTSLQSANKADRYVQLSPIPAVDYVNFTSYTDMSRIEIYSLGGQLVKAVNVSGDTYRMDISGINSGMYVARIYSEKGISSKKLIVR